jgi:hypothetical protein
MRVIFFGTLCTFSTAPLIEAGHDMRGRDPPGAIGDRPIVSLNPPPHPIAGQRLADNRRLQQLLPVSNNRLSAEPARYRCADVACVACFQTHPRPCSIRAGASEHPSSPAASYRGPYPLFWMLATGWRFWVTIHLRMSARCR